MSSGLAAWLLAAAIHFAPPERQPDFPGYEETVEETAARYGSIVTDIVAAATKSKHPKSAASMMLAFAIGESFLAKDADVGPCFRGVHLGFNYRARCDAGAAASIWQLQVALDRETGDRLTSEQVFADRARTARVVLRAMQGSFLACHKLPREDQLSGFGIGRCVEGNEQVRKRYRLWQAVFAWKPKETKTP